MSDICQSCTIKISSNQHRISCAGCFKRYHATCLDLTAADLQYLKEKKEKWTCPQCLTTVRRARLGSDCTPVKTTTEQQIGEQATSSFEDDKPVTKGKKNTEPTLSEIMQQIKMLAISLESCHNQLQEVNAHLQNQDGIIQSCISKIDELNSTNKHLQQENLVLKNRINDLEQYSRLNCLEIYGIPEPKDEVVLSTVQAVGRSLHCEIESNMIDACHRLKKNPAKPQEPRGIIVKFVSRLCKEEFIKARKIKRDFNTRHLTEELPHVKNYPQANVYINESLTKANRILLSHCREFQKKHSIKYIWVRNGKIMARKSETSKVFVIKTEDDLRDVH